MKFVQNRLSKQPLFTLLFHHQAPKAKAVPRLRSIRDITIQHDLMRLLVSPIAGAIDEMSRPARADELA